jgi:hypothetical protein
VRSGKTWDEVHANQPPPAPYRLGLRPVSPGSKKRAFSLLAMLLALAIAPAIATGCGDDSDDGDASAAAEAEFQLKEAAAEKAKKAADKVVQATPDKNLPGPKSYKAVCVVRGDPEAPQEVPPNMVRCHIEAFFDAYRGKPGGYLWSEDWIMPIEAGNKPGTPVISGDYRIRNFLREDNKRNCTGRHRPSQCLPQSVGGELPG